MAKENNQEPVNEKKASAITNEKGLIYKPDENKLVVKGTLTAFRFSTTKYKGDTETYQVSVHTPSLTAEVIEDIKKRYFSDTKDRYLPSFIKDAEKDGTKDPLYINLQSQYEFGTFLPGEGNKRYSFDDVIELGDGLAPRGSEVTLSMRLKEGAIYPLALRIDKLNKQDAADFFE